MLSWIWCIPALPARSGSSCWPSSAGGSPQRASAVVGAGSVGLSPLVAAASPSSFAFVASPPGGIAFTQTLWQWISVGGFSPQRRLLPRRPLAW